MEDVALRLARAAESAEVIKIKYQGGSKPGTVREIAPINVNADSRKVRARCFLSNAVKTFLIDKIEFAGESEEVVVVTANDFSHLKSLREVFDSMRLGWESDGWDVEYISGSEDCPEDEEIAFYRYFKNGNRMKTPTLCISKFRYDLLVDGELPGATESVVERDRPYIVRGMGKRASSFKTLNKALLSFTEKYPELINKIGPLSRLKMKGGS